MRPDGTKWACQSCLKGHRVSGCTHTGRSAAAALLRRWLSDLQLTDATLSQIANSSLFPKRVGLLHNVSTAGKNARKGPPTSNASVASQINPITPKRNAYTSVRPKRKQKPTVSTKTTTMKRTMRTWLRSRRNRAAAVPTAASVHAHCSRRKTPMTGALHMESPQCKSHA